MHTLTVNDVKRNYFLAHIKNQLIKVKIVKTPEIALVSGY